MSNAKEKRHLDRLAKVGCILCKTFFFVEDTPAEIHHIRLDEGGAQRASDYLGVPLCLEHHRGNSGLHGLGTHGFYTRYRLSELDLLALTLEALES